LKPIKVTIDTREGRTASLGDQLVTYGALSALGIDINAKTQASYLPPTAKITGDKIPPGVPSGLTVTPVGINSHKLLWQNPDDDDLWSIEVWVSHSNDIVSASLLAVVTISESQRGIQSVYLNSGINSSYDYYYFIRAKDWSGNVSNWAEVGSVAAEDNPTLDDLIAELTGVIDYAQLSATLQGDVDLAAGLDGKLVLSNNVDGHISGVILVNDGSVSDFTIVCDKFKIVNNSDPYNITVPFVVGTVDGSPAVGINGALLVDGSIMARSIDTGSISITSLGGAGTLATQDTVSWSDITGNDNVVRTFYQASDPTSGMLIGDIWINSNSREMYRYNGSAWVSVQDGDIVAAISTASAALSTANTKILTFYTSFVPTATAIGDLWYNTSTYLLKRWNGSSWSEVSNYTTNTNQLVDGASLGLKATWAQVSSIPVRFADAPSTTGLYLTSSYLGFYDSGWKSYINNSGQFFFGGNTDNYISWNGSSLVVVTSSSNGITVKAGGDINLIGEDINPGVLRLVGTSYYTNFYTSSTGAGSYIAPSANGAQSLSIGTSSYKFQSIYLTASSYVNLTSNSSVVISCPSIQLTTGSYAVVFVANSLRPTSNNAVDCGDAAYKWANVHGVNGIFTRIGVNTNGSSSVSLVAHGVGTTSSTYSIMGADSGGTNYFYCRDDRKIWCSDGIWYTSDERLKKNIAPIEDLVGGKMLSLPVKRFNLIGDDAQSAGFLAQDLKGFIPEATMEFYHPKRTAVTKTVESPVLNDSGEETGEMETKTITEYEEAIDDIATLAIKNGPILAYLVKWGQEQQSYIDALADRIETLESTRN
jgi:hypothetical protein